MVTAPEGWVPPQESNSGVGQTGSVADSEFADIDSILKQKQGPGTKGKQSPGTKGKPVSKGRGGGPQKPSRATAAPKQAQRQQPRPANPELQPILPNIDWIAGATQRKRRNLLIGMGAVGLLALISFTVMYFVSSRSNEQSVASNNDDQVVTPDEPETVDSDKPEEPVSNTTDTVEQPNKNNTVTPDPIEPIEKPEPTVDEAVNGSADRTPPEAEVEQPAKPPEETEETKEQKNIPSPFSGGLEDILDQRTLQAPASSNSLADLLEDSGSSITDISQEASAISDRRQIGLPKYFIKSPPALDARSLEKFNDPVGSVQYTGQSLLTIVAELSQITGVPISFDCDHLNAIEFDFGSKVDDFQVSDSDFQTALEKLLIGMNDQLGIQYNGSSPATISVADTEAIGTATFDSPESKSRTPEGFMDLIRQLIEPASWTNDQSSIRFENDKIAVDNSIFVRQRVGKFLGKWKTAASRTTGDWPDSLKSKTKIFAATRELPNSFRNKYSLPCSIYLAEIQKAAGVNIVFDFNTLLKFGWNQNTQFPMDIDEPTIGEFVDEVAHSMDVVSRIIDAETIELTDAVALATKTDLEFYDVSKLLAGRFNAQNLVALVRELLQNTDSSNLRIYVDTEIESLIVVGPQPVQQRLEALLDQVSEIELK